MCPYQPKHKKGNTVLKKEVVIFDLDGTLALIDERRDLARNEKGKLDWKVFHNPDNIHLDKPNWPVIECARNFKKAGYIIFIFSGRSDVTLAKTQAWLKKFQIPYDKLVMRPHKTLNFVPDDKLKMKMLDESLADVDQIFCVFDDRQKVVDMWRSLGLTCMQVAPGDF